MHLTFELRYESNDFCSIGKKVQKPFHTVMYSGETDDSLAFGYDKYFMSGFP